jgi:hypothetical protein
MDSSKRKLEADGQNEQPPTRKQRIDFATGHRSDRSKSHPPDMLRRTLTGDRQRAQSLPPDTKVPEIPSRQISSRPSFYQLETELEDLLNKHREQFDALARGNSDFNPENFRYNIDEEKKNAKCC